MKNNTCCFSGHRPQKIIWKDKEQSQEYCEIITRTQKEIVNAIDNGYIFFITGMAIGYDMSCAEIVLSLKKQYPDIKLICALPCKEQDKYWREADKLKYKKILSQADKIIYTSTVYTKECMRKRNEYMLSQSSLLIAFFNGNSGGTKTTVEAARKMQIETRIIF